MNIQEAVIKALETDGQIYRQQYTESFSGQLSIKPTNGYATCCCCIDGVPDPKGRAWNPTAEDLVATDWEVITSEDAPKEKDLWRYKLLQLEIKDNGTRDCLVLNGRPLHGVAEYKVVKSSMDPHRTAMLTLKAMVNLI